jgi:hypothetical protein
LLPSNVTIFGDEKTRTAITDLRDVGKFVARIVTDERTVNKYVFCYGEVLPQQKIFSMLEEISEEQVERIQVCWLSSIFISIHGECTVKVSALTMTPTFPSRSPPNNYNLFTWRLRRSLNLTQEISFMRLPSRV